MTWNFPYRPWYQPSSIAVGLDMGVSGWHQGRYGKCHVIIFYYLLIWTNWFLVFKVWFGIQNTWQTKIRQIKVRYFVYLHSSLFVIFIRTSMSMYNTPYVDRKILYADIKPLYVDINTFYVDMNTLYVDINTLYVDIRIVYVDIHTLYAVDISTVCIFRYAHLMLRRNTQPLHQLTLFNRNKFDLRK